MELLANYSVSSVLVLPTAMALLVVMGTPFRGFLLSPCGLARRFGIDVDSVFDVRYRIVLQQCLQSAFELRVVDFANCVLPFESI